jgi:hypothetical protein
MPGTSVLPDAWMIDAEIERTTKIAKLQIAAHECGGACTKVFGQGGTGSEWDRSQSKSLTQTAQLGLAKWYKLRFKKPGVRMAGVCKALSVYWLGFHANDEDFWGWLTNNGFIRVDVAAHIITEHQESTKGAGQSAWERNILATVGVIPQAGGTSFDQDTSSLSGVVRGRTIAQAIAPDKGRWGYKSISYRRVGATGGHATVAWVGQDVTYFDPNYGEFWFENRANFRTWFSRYWAISGYAYERFIIRPFGKSLNSVRGRNNWM